MTLINKMVLTISEEKHEKNLVVLLAVALGLFLLNPLAARGDTWFTVYSYYRNADPDNRAWISVGTVMDTQMGAEGGYLPTYPSGHEPSILQSGFDESRNWDWGWPPSPSPWAILTSNRSFESQSNLRFIHPYPTCYGLTCLYSPLPYPGQNPSVELSGYAQPGNLKVGGVTEAGSTGKRMPPVAKATFVATVKNHFTVLPGTSSKGTGEPAQLSLAFRLNGTLSADTYAFSRMMASLSVQKEDETLASANGSVLIYNQSSGQTSGYRSLSYSTNSGINNSTSGNTDPSYCDYDTGLMNLNFNGVVGNTYEVTLSLSLLSQTDGSADYTDYAMAPGRTNFSGSSRGFAASISGDDGVVLSWEAQPAPVLMDYVDFDGDRAPDVAAYHLPSNQFLTGYGGNLGQYGWGGADSYPLVWDYNGDGATDVSIYHIPTNQWLVSGQPGDNLGQFGWGEEESIPVPGDYNGDGVMDRAFYHWPTSRWFVEGQEPIQFDCQGADCLPLPGDYDGDGKTDMVLYDLSSNRWFLYGFGDLGQYGWGGAESIPIPADYDGDGKVEIAFYHVPTNQWFVKGSPGDNWGQYGWGGMESFPIPADYNGDGVAQRAFYRPAENRWFIEGQPEFFWGYDGGSFMPVTGQINIFNWFRFVLGKFQ